MLGRTSVRGLITLALIALMAVGVGLWSQSPAKADCPAGTPNCVELPTTAVLGGGTGTGMTIECKWELPDASATDMAMTYGTNDDTPLVLADAPACAPGVPAAANRHHMIGILPNQADSPIQRQYEKWVAVQSANVGEITNVYWDVWEPYVASPPNGPNCASPVTFDGVQYCFKYQHYATANLLPPSPTNPLIVFTKTNAGSCLALQAMTDMFTEAVNTGQMSSAEPANIIDKCFQGEKAIFRVQEQISKEQPWGEYRVQVSVINSAGTAFRNVNFFDVLPFIYINKDFTSVDWQNIYNGGTYTVSGDMTMETPGPAKADGSGVKPTIENTGNQLMYVWTHFTPLALVGNTSKTITHFDSAFRAAWRTDPSTLQSYDPQYASTWDCFDQHPLGSDDTGKLDLSVHPETAEGGTYNGTVNVFGGIDCTTHP